MDSWLQTFSGSSMKPSAPDLEESLLPGDSSQSSTPRSTRPRHPWLAKLKPLGLDGLPHHAGKRHHALIGAREVHVESLDYETVESEVYKGDIKARTDVEEFELHTLKWVFALAIGLGTAVTAFAINMAVENIAGFKFLVTDYFMQRGHFFLAFLVYAAINVTLVSAAATLCVLVAPAAAGSGIPEVKAYLNGIDTPNILALKTLAVKILGSVGSVAGGLAVGKEGPLVHTGACIASFLGQGGSTKWGLNYRFLRWFKNDRDRRDLVTCGAAAGVGAAFRAPVGGVLFALEEATSWWRSKLLWRAFFTTAVVAITLRALMSYCANGQCGLFGDAGFIIFDQSSMKSSFGLLELLPVCIIGTTGGILGGLFNKINVWICTWRRDELSKGGGNIKILEAALVALTTSACSYGIPWLTKCTPCPDAKLNPGILCPNNGRAGNFKGFHCPPGHYSDLAGLLFSTNDDATRNLFSARTPNEFHYSSLLTFLGTIYVLAVTTYGIAVPSGLFVPAILTGSAYGRIVGMFMANHFGRERMDEGTYALLGAASFLGGSMRMTVSICVILIELTSNLEMLPLLMVTLLISKTIGDTFNEAIYDLHIHLKRIPYLEQFPEPFMANMTAINAINPAVLTNPDDELKSFYSVERITTIVQALKSTRHNAFPVNDMNADGQESFYGLILRNHLLVLLKNKNNYQATKESAIQLGPDMEPVMKHSSLEFGKPGSGKSPSSDDINITHAEGGMYLDLRPYTNRSPYTVPQSMSLFKVYQIFRGIGLRHLVVVPDPKKILGLITRKDLLGETYHEGISDD